MPSVPILYPGLILLKYNLRASPLVMIGIANHQQIRVLPWTWKPLGKSMRWFPSYPITNISDVKETPGTISMVMVMAVSAPTLT